MWKSRRPESRRAGGGDEAVESRRAAPLKSFRWSCDGRDGARREKEETPIESRKVAQSREVSASGRGIRNPAPRRRPGGRVVAGGICCTPATGWIRRDSKIGGINAPRPPPPPRWLNAVGSEQKEPGGRRWGNHPLPPGPGVEDKAPQMGSAQRIAPAPPRKVLVRRVCTRGVGVWEVEPGGVPQRRRPPPAPPGPEGGGGGETPPRGSDRRRAGGTGLAAPAQTNGPSSPVPG